MVEYTSGRKMEISDKTNQRTHHTRFFEKLYGNLEKSSESKDEKLDQNFQFNIPVESCRPEVINSPSESSGSSSEIFHNDVHSSRCANQFFNRSSFFKTIGKFPQELDVSQHQRDGIKQFSFDHHSVAFWRNQIADWIPERSTQPFRCLPWVWICSLNSRKSLSAPWVRLTDERDCQWRRHPSAKCLEGRKLWNNFNLMFILVPFDFFRHRSDWISFGSESRYKWLYPI